MRHDKVCAHLHYSKLHTHIHTHTHTHTHTQTSERRDVTVLWNERVHTDRGVTANRPDIIIKNKKREKKTGILIDVSMPADRNVVQKEAEKKFITRVYV